MRKGAGEPRNGKEGSQPSGGRANPPPDRTGYLALERLPQAATWGTDQRPEQVREEVGQWLSQAEPQMGSKEAQKPEARSPLSRGSPREPADGGRASVHGTCWAAGLWPAPRGCRARVLRAQVPPVSVQTLLLS